MYLLVFYKQKKNNRHELVHGLTLKCSETFSFCFFPVNHYFLVILGYGRVTPLSEAGKGFCILYAIIGIPLTLIMFTAIVERLMIPTAWFLQFMFRKLGHLYKVFHIQLLHLSIIIILVIVFFYLIPAAIYVTIEPNWNYLDAFYYCFISLTTVGLGDYIPGDSPDQPLRPLYKVATTCKYSDILLSLPVF
jgi:potassium channel subfamily K protein 1